MRQITESKLEYAVTPPTFFIAGAAGCLGSYDLHKFLDDKSTCNRSRASQERNGGFQSARKHREGLQRDTSSPNNRLWVV